MNTQGSAVALRNLIVAALGAPFDSGAPGDSLHGVNTTTLPDGALIYVVSTKTAYRLDKTSVLPADARGAVIVPSAGPGAWLFVSGAADPRLMQAVGTAALAGSSPFAPGANTWVALPSVSGAYSNAITPSLTLALDTTTGIVTYTGPTGAMYLAQATATIASATAADVLEFGLQKGTDALIGTTGTLFSSGIATVDTTTAPLGAQIATQRILTLTNGDTIQPIVRNVTGAHNVTVTHFNLILSPA